MLYQLSDEQSTRVMNVFWEDAPLESLQTTEELHDFAWNYNWDDGLEAMRWVLNHPACDKGTALLIYWRSSPGYFCQYANRDAATDFERETYDFVIELEQKYLAGAFQQETIAFDPKDDKGFDHTTAYADYPIRRPIPSEMYQVTSGRHMQRGSY